MGDLYLCEKVFSFYLFISVFITLQYACWLDMVVKATMFLYILTFDCLLVFVCMCLFVIYIMVHVFLVFPVCFY